MLFVDNADVSGAIETVEAPQEPFGMVSVAQQVTTTDEQSPLFNDMVTVGGGGGEPTGGWSGYTGPEPEDWTYRYTEGEWHYMTALGVNFRFSDSGDFQLDPATFSTEAPEWADVFVTFQVFGLPSTNEALFSNDEEPWWERLVRWVTGVPRVDNDTTAAERERIANDLDRRARNWDRQADGAQRARELWPATRGEPGEAGARAGEAAARAQAAINRGMSQHIRSGGNM